MFNRDVPAACIVHHVPAATQPPELITTTLDDVVMPPDAPQGISEVAVHLYIVYKEDVSTRPEVNQSKNILTLW